MDVDLEEPQEITAHDRQWLRSVGWQLGQLLVNPNVGAYSAELHAFGFSRREFYEIPRSYFGPGGSSGGYPAVASQTRAGWPLQSLTGAQILDLDKNELNSVGEQVDDVYRYRHALRITISAGRLGPSPRPLPWFPKWPGFITNTLFYAALLWLPICGPFTLRRFVRVKRGLCPKCAYPVGESEACSECGAELVTRATT